MTKEPNFDVIAFEVNPKTFSRLLENSKLHDFVPFNYGLGDCCEKVEFVVGAVSHVTTRTELASAYNIKNNSFLGEIRPLSGFDVKGSIILKIDVEGQELAVLKGAMKFFDRGQVDTVYLDGYGDKLCFEMLSDYGFVLLDGRTMQPATSETFSLLGIKEGVA